MISKEEFMIYLDYNATAPYSPSVKDYISNSMVNDWANPSSEHDAGYSLSTQIKSSRGKIAEFLDVSSKSLVFTSSATESINTILSLDNLKHNNITTIISSKLEHHATLDRLDYLSKSGIQILYIKNDKQGNLNLEQLEVLLSETKNTLISLLFVNNEIGVINPIQEISKIARKHDSLIHVDGVQALGKVDFNLDALDVDFASFSGHKIGAMKGIGLTYAQDINSLTPLMHGGGQERGYRPSTLNFSAIKSFELAVNDIDFSHNDEIKALRDSLETQLLNLGFTVNCSEGQRVYNTSNIYLKGEDARAMLLRLSRQNIMVSTGSACSSGSYEPSHVLTELGFDKEYASSCLRVSLGRYSALDEIETFLKNIL